MEKYLTRDVMPRWYGLSWDGQENAIRIQLRRDVPLPHKAWDPAHNHRIDHYWRQFGFQSFESGFGRGFGFDRALVIVSDPSAEYLEFIGRLPRVRIASQRKCFDCKGTGSGRTGPCFACSGTGKYHDLKWRRADALAASIDILLAPLEYNEFETDAKDPQLLTVHSPVWEVGAAIGGVIGIPFRRWARQYPQYTEFIDVEAAMKQAYSRMMGESYAAVARFFAKIYSDKHHFTLDHFGRGGVWGGPDDDSGENHGYEFHSKDVDASLDQLVFLAGLAALHDRADREIKAQQKTA